MTLLDDLEHMTRFVETETRASAIASAYWLFERNPWLSLDEQARGIAFLVTSFLHEQEPHVRTAYTRVIRHLLLRRTYGVGTYITWDPLISQLPQLSLYEVQLVLFLLKYAEDARYLPLLESYFDDLDLGREAVDSWIHLMFTQHYTYDLQATTYLAKAEKTIRDQFGRWHLDISRHGGEARKSMLNRPPEKRQRKAWIQQVLDEAQEQIRQHVQVQDRRAEVRINVEQEHYKESPYYFPNKIRDWLAQPTREGKIAGRIGNLDWVFETDYTIPIEELAQTVQVLVDYALSGEDRHVASSIWDVLPFAFDNRRYAGMYLDWERLARVLLTEGKAPGEFPLSQRDQRHLLSYFGYAPDQRYLDLLYSFLLHPDLYLREVALVALERLLRHLAHYCPQSSLLSKEADKILQQRRTMPESPEKWTLLTNTLKMLEQDVRPYFHYYSI